MAAELDQDPFLLFELKGLSREVLQKELVKSPLGQALCAKLADVSNIPRPNNSYYTTPMLQPAKGIADLRDFWLGAKRLPQTMEELSTASVPAILVKKQGDFPAFWKKENSFIAVMEEFYRQVKTKNTHIL